MTKILTGICLEKKYKNWWISIKATLKMEEDAVKYFEYLLKLNIITLIKNS